MRIPAAARVPLHLLCVLSLAGLSSGPAGLALPARKTRKHRSKRLRAQVGSSASSGAEACWVWSPIEVSLCSPQQASVQVPPFAADWLLLRHAAAWPRSPQMLALPLIAASQVLKRSNFPELRSPDWRSSVGGSPVIRGSWFVFLPLTAAGAVFQFFFQHVRTHSCIML